MIALALVALPGGAAAQSVPRFTPDQMCGYAGSASAYFNACLHQEQVAYDRLRPLWAALSPRGRTFCASYVRQYHQTTYTNLRACAQGQYARDGATAPRDTFNY